MPRPRGRSWPSSGWGSGETLLVANSKALHHLLPGLVPPIDRNYTLRFFVGRPHIYRGWDAELLFLAIYPLFHEIAVRCAGEIHELLAKPLEGMNTSVTKVIDNAILGFMLRGSRGSYREGLEGPRREGLRME